VDTVDVHYRREMMKSQITSNGVDLERAEEIKRIELGVYKKADMVIALTEEDATILKEDCPDLTVRIIPNIHHLKLSDQSPDKNTLIFVGGFSHDPNIDAVLYFCKDVLPFIRREVPNIQVNIVGSHPPRQIEELKSEFINVTGYVPSTTPYLHSSYVSVAPCDMDPG
jgi:glycosyltransferase involved in cell wall biosynthesis